MLGTIHNRIHPLLYVLIVAAISRIGFVFVTGISETSFGDVGDYIDAAQSFCDGTPYPERGALPFFRAPFYPLFIAALSFCNLHSIFLLKLLQVALDCSSVGLVYVVCRMLTPSVRAGLVASTLAALYPPFFLNIKDLQSEPLFTFLLLLAMLLLVRGHQRNQNVFFSLAGLFLGLAALTRPVIPGFFSILLIWVLIQYRFPIAVRRFFIVCCFFFTAVFPWSLRNYFRFQDFILVNDAGGYAFWRDNNEIGWKTLTSKTQEEYNRYHRAIFEKTEEKDLIIRSQWKTPKSRERAWFRLAFDEISKNLGMWIGRWFYKMIYFWRLWLNPNAYPISVVLLSFFVFAFTYVTGVYGMILCYGQVRAEVQLFVGLFLFATVAHAAFLPGIRMRVPFVDPYLIVFCGITLATWYEKLRVRV
jgi:4-amino-4-deoxy-L-arabinose transferase-like glycosyltransferase